MKKILYIITKSNWGGAQKAVFDLATHPKIVNNYKVIVASGSDGELLERLSQKNIKTHNLHIHNTINIFAAPFDFLRLYLYIRKEKPSIIHLHSSKISLFGALAGRLAGTPMIIFTAHGWAHNEDRNIFVKLVLRVLMWCTVALCHRTIAVSEEVVRSLRPPKYCKKKMVVIYNGLQKEVVIPLPKLSSGVPADKHIKHLVSIGELNDNKNHASVIRILPQVKNVHYHIIGEGVDRAKLEKLITEKNLEKRITLYGHVTNAKKLLPQYDVFILPSKTEALPYVILEALQAGLPVIARKVGGIPEILRDAPYGRVYTYDIDLIDILAQDMPTDFVWNDGRFDFEKMIEKTLYVYG